MDDLVMMLRGAMAAEGKVGLMMNVLKTNLPAVLKVLPNANPTISPLADGVGVDVVVIMEEHVVRRIVPQLKQAGATSIVEYALNKIID
jgi:ATP phosphoribosyltransferase